MRWCATGSGAVCGPRPVSSARAGTLPEGAYLIGASAEVAEMPWPELVSTLAELVAEVPR